MIVARLLIIAASILVASPIDGAETKRPNVLFIAVDDLNNEALGLRSDSRAKTPHLERLARRGVLFTKAYCAAPACNPSRVSVMTGVAPAFSGVYVNKQDWRNCKQLAGLPTMPQHFRDHGYKVVGGGKLYHAANLSLEGLEGFLDAEPWHEYFPSKNRQLPDEYVPPKQSINTTNRFYGGRFDWNRLNVDDKEMGDAKVVRWAEQQLAQSYDQPLFLAVGIYRPHIPWYTPQSWFQQYPLESIELPKRVAEDVADIPDPGRAMTRHTWHHWLASNNKWKEATQAYLASASFADAMVGRLLDALDRGPLADNTIVVLWSDHGYHLGHKEHWEKRALWEQTTQVPLIVVDTRNQSRVAANQRCAAPVSLLDLFPTMVEMCDLQELGHLQGESLMSTLSRSGQPSDRAVVMTQDRNNHAVRWRHWRFIRYADASEELYRHDRDPHERDNLAGDAAHAAIKRRLASFLPTKNAPHSPPIQE